MTDFMTKLVGLQKIVNGGIPNTRSPYGGDYEDNHSVNINVNNSTRLSSNVYYGKFRPEDLSYNSDEMWTVEECCKWVTSVIASVQNMIAEQESNGMNLKKIYFVNKRCDSLVLEFSDDQGHNDIKVITCNEEEE